MSKDNNKKSFLPPRTNPIEVKVRNYRPTSPPPPHLGGVTSTRVVVEEMLKYANPLRPMKELVVNESRHHKATNIGNTNDKAHRVSGPLTTCVYNFLDNKYLRYYGYLDGVMRFCYLRAEGGARTILHQYISEFLLVMRDGGDVSCFNARKWRNGRFLALFTVINNVNRRRDDFDCPINDLNLVASLKPDHPRYEDAIAYLRHYQDNSVFGFVSGQFANLVKTLARDVREYDVNIQLKDHTFGYKIRKEFYNDVGQYLTSTRAQPESIVRISALEIDYDKNALFAKCRADCLDILYVDNIRVLFYKLEGHSLLHMCPSSNAISERNLYEFIAHDYRKIGNGFYSSNSGESDAMEIIRNNMATIECHMRPKYGKFFLSFKRLSNQGSSFEVTCTFDATKKTFSTVTSLQMRFSSAVYLGYITNGHMVITDLLRVNQREANSDLTRAAFDDSNEKEFCNLNFAIHGKFNDQDAYDVILRSEYGVFRAKSLVKYRVYDKVGWFYDYLQIMGVDKFDTLYDVLDDKLVKIIESVKINLREKVNRNYQMLIANEGSEDLILTLDNRFIPPLIVDAMYVPTNIRRAKTFQTVNGDLYQLNKYYVLSRASAKLFSIDPPDRPFYEGYDDGIFRYKPCPVELSTTTFARFPNEWQDEIYTDGNLDYKKNHEFELLARNLDVTAEEDYCETVNIYQPYHHSAEEAFMTQLQNMSLEPNCFMRKKNTKRSRKKNDNHDCLGDEKVKS